MAWSVLASDPGDWLVTYLNHKKCVFCVSKTVFKTFSVFPSNFCDCSLSSPFSFSQTLCVSLKKAFIFATFNLQSSRKRYGFSLSHFIFHVLRVLFLILWVCCCHYALKSIMFIRGFAFSWWVFFDWELVFLTLILLFIWSLCSVLCFMNVLFHSYHVYGILSHYLSFESL